MDLIHDCNEDKVPKNGINSQFKAIPLCSGNFAELIERAGITMIAFPPHGFTGKTSQSESSLSSVDHQSKVRAAIENEQ